MKTTHLIGLVGFTMMAMAACSPAAYVEKDPGANLSAYKTYAWVDTRDSQDQTTAGPTEFAKLSLQNAANEQLKQKGLSLVSEQPDVLLSYDILVERNVEQKSDPVYTRPMTRLYYNPYFRRWGTIYYPASFVGYDTYTVPVKDATLTINIMDANTDKTVWQGWTTQTVNSRLLSPDEIRSSVKAILKKLDIGKG
jgi:hypothetical protein